jgi:acyl-homoserine lactone acylase PvdQ
MKPKIIAIISITIFISIYIFYESTPAQINRQLKSSGTDINNSVLSDSVESRITLIAPDNSVVTVSRDTFGVPHIAAETETGVFYGQGFAAAQDRLFQMELYRRWAEGKLAAWLGGPGTGFDRFTLNRFYRESEIENQFNSLPSEIQNAYISYAAGVNAYIDSMDVNPQQYKPYEFTLPGIEMEPWSAYKSLKVMIRLSRPFGEFGGEELDRLLELQDNGWTWFNDHRPINDPNAPTTIQYGKRSTPQKYHYSGMTVAPEVVNSIREGRELIDSLARILEFPTTFGSYAVQITPSKSDSGNVMLLGCPQISLPAPLSTGVNPTYEVELYCHTFHVGGMAFAGIPMIAIGHNEFCSWSWTSGVSDDLDLYIDSTFDDTYSTYWYNGKWLPFDVFVDTIFVNGGSPEIFTHYRTVHGPTLVANDLENHQVYSLKMTFWNEEINTLKYIYDQMKAQSLADYEAALSFNTLSFNVFYIDKENNVKYWHAGKYQDRTDGVDPRLPHKGDGSEEWNGFIPFSDLPSASGPSWGYFDNWNNKPVSWWDNGDNVPWIPDDPIGVYDRILQIRNYVDSINSFTYENLENVPFAIQSHGTYQQAIEMSPTEIIDENLLSPGQSGFRDINGNYSPHYSDQLPLYNNWEFKDQIFGDSSFVPVAVELASFSGNCVNQAVTLSWITATETNNQGFEVQRSRNGKDFAVIGFVEGNGTTTRTQTYSYTDKNLSSGKYYYQLKQIDFDGSYEYSDVVEVTVNVPTVFSLEQNYPNPFNPSTTIKYSIPEKSIVTLKVYDILGAEIETLINEEKPAGNYELKSNAANLPSGVYFYQLEAGGYMAVKKMILLK